MKKTISTLTIIFMLFCGISFSPAKAAAYNEGTNVIHNIFVDTLYGMAVGLVLGAAISAAQGEDGSDLTKNIGAGAAIGGILGATYGIVLEYKGLAEIKNNKVCLHVPTLALSSNPDSGELMLHTDLLKFHF